MTRLVILSVLSFTLIGSAQTPNHQTNISCYVLAMGYDSKGEFASSRITEPKDGVYNDNILNFKDTLKFSQERAISISVRLNTKTAQLSAGMNDLSVDGRRGEGSSFIGWVDLSSGRIFSFDFSTNMPIAEGYLSERENKGLMTVTKLNLSCVYQVVVQ